MWTARRGQPTSGGAGKTVEVVLLVLTGNHGYRSLWVCWTSVNVSRRNAETLDGGTIQP
jgi:hypothetical protein